VINSVNRYNISAVQSSILATSLPAAFTRHEF